MCVLFCFQKISTAQSPVVALRYIYIFMNTCAAIWMAKEVNSIGRMSFAKRRNGRVQKGVRPPVTRRQYSSHDLQAGVIFDGVKNGETYPRPRNGTNVDQRLRVTHFGPHPRVKSH